MTTTDDFTFASIADYPFPLPAQDSLLEALLEDVTAHLFQSLDQSRANPDHFVEGTTIALRDRMCIAATEWGCQRKPFGIISLEAVRLLGVLRLVSKRFQATVHGSSAWLFATLQCHMRNIDGHDFNMLDTISMRGVPFREGKVDTTDEFRLPRLSGRSGSAYCCLGVTDRVEGLGECATRDSTILIAVLTGLAEKYSHFVAGVCDAMDLPRETISYLPFFHYEEEDHAQFFGAQARRFPRRFTIEFFPFACDRAPECAVWIFRMFCFRSNRHIWCVFTFYGRGGGPLSASRHHHSKIQYSSRVCRRHHRRTYGAHCDGVGNRWQS